MSWDRFNRRLDAGPSQATFAVWRWLVLVLVLSGVTFGAAWVVIKPFSAASTVLDTNNVIYNYEWFKNTHEDVKSLDVQIRTAVTQVEQFKADAGPRANWHREDREEYSRLNAILQGLRNQRAEVAANYNARARQINRSIFMGTDTPTSIPLEGK